MGNYISIGIVYSDKNIQKINVDILFLARYLLPFCHKISVNYPIDNSFEDWEEKIFEGEKGLVEAFAILIRKEMSIGKISFKLNDYVYNILVSVRGKDDLFKGILFEIPEKELLQEDYSIENQSDITKQIINRILELWNGMEFGYAFCDSEASIEFQQSEIEQIKEPIYSVLLLKRNAIQPTIQLSSWCIDGITQRR